MSFRTLNTFMLVPLNATLSLVLGSLRLQQATLLYPWKFCPSVCTRQPKLPSFLLTAANDPSNHVSDGHENSLCRGNAGVRTSQSQT